MPQFTEEGLKENNEFMSWMKVIAEEKCHACTDFSCLDACPYADVAGVWRFKNTEEIKEVSNENKEKDNHRGNRGFLSGSHEDVVEQGKREVEAGFMPQINPISVNLADYDVIAIGTPTWWYTMAPAVLTFLPTNDFTGKTVLAGGC